MTDNPANVPRPLPPRPQRRADRKPAQPVPGPQDGLQAPARPQPDPPAAGPDDPGNPLAPRGALMRAYAIVTGHDDQALEEAGHLIRENRPPGKLPLDPLWPYLDNGANLRWLSVSEVAEDTPDFLTVLNGYAWHLKSREWKG